MARKQNTRRKQQQQRRQKKQQRRSRRGSSSRSSRPFPGSSDPLLTVQYWITLQESICAGDAAAIQSALGDLVSRGEDVMTIASETLNDFAWDLWSGGWRPLELVRQVKRSQKSAHASLIAVAILAPADTYQEKSRQGRPVFDDPDWGRELDQIRTDYSWTQQLRETHLVEDWMASSQHDLRSAVLIAAETVHALTHLPPLDVLGPYPGGPEFTMTGSGHLPDKVIDKVSALLRKAESTEFPEEADALTTKAQQIMTRHAFDHAILAAEQAARVETPELRRVPVDNPHAHGRALLLQQIAEATRCRSVWNKEFGWATLGGFSVDIDAVELLYGSLLVQATRAILGHGSIKDSHGRSRTAAFRKSFMLSFAQRVGERLRTDTATTTKDAAGVYGDQLLPVLAARNATVDDLWAETQEPHIHHSRGPAISHHGGYAAGRFAADQADLGEKLAMSIT